VVKALLPDTNFWLHGRRPFDFQLIADGENNFVVVVPRRVLQELDEKQHEGRRSLRNRARDVVFGFRALTKRGHVSNDRIESSDQGVIYWFVPDAKVEAGTSADVVIIQTAMALKGAANVVVVTSDGAMEVTARIAGLEVYSVPGDLLELDEPDPVEQEVAALKKKVEKLEQPQQLDVQVIGQILFPPSGEIAQILRLDQPSPQELEDARKEIQVRLAFNDPAYAANAGVGMYNATVPGYATKVAEYLAAAARWEATAEAGLWVQLLIINRTSTPVGNPILDLRAPEHVTFAYPPPKPEHPPALPRPTDLIAPPAQTAANRMIADIVGAASMGSYHIPVMSYIKPVQARGPWLNTDESSIESKLDEPLRPDYEEFAGKVWIGIEPEFEDTDLEIPFVLYAAAASKPFSGKLVIRLEHRHEAWRPPALPSRDNPKCGPIERPSQHERWVIRDMQRNR
jgi:rRNA-processing protein FCF1